MHEGVRFLGQVVVKYMLTPFFLLVPLIQCRETARSSIEMEYDKQQVPPARPLRLPSLYMLTWPLKLNGKGM
jgi:hypothetical protein